MRGIKRINQIKRKESIKTSAACSSICLCSFPSYAQIKIGSRSVSSHGSADLGIDLVLGNLLGLGLLAGEESAEPAQGITGDDQARGHGGLSLGDEAFTTDLLGLAGPHANDVFPALIGLLDGEEYNALALVVQLRCWFLDGWEGAIELGQRRIAQRVGTRHVRRDVRVGLREVWKDGRGELVVARVRDGNGLLAQRVGFERLDRIRDYGVGDEVLCGCKYGEEMQDMASEGRISLTWRKTEEGFSPLTCGAISEVGEEA
jgi:hypothetical protein